MSTESISLAELEKRYPQLIKHLKEIEQADPEEKTWVEFFLKTLTNSDNVFISNSERFMKGIIRHIFTVEEISKDRSAVITFKNFIKGCVSDLGKQFFAIEGFHDAVCTALEEPKHLQRTFNYNDVSTFMISLLARHRQNILDDVLIRLLAQCAIAEGFIGLINTCNSLCENSGPGNNNAFFKDGKAKEMQEVMSSFPRGFNLKEELDGISTENSHEVNMEHLDSAFKRVGWYKQKIP